MNFLIVEDEEQAAKRLIRLIRKLEPKAFIHGSLESIKEVVEWLEANPEPDLILMDIHLSDGLSFDIWNHLDLQVPVIFTTAYDQYALRAFKFNSVHYLLKPIEEDALSEALKKFRSNTSVPDSIGSSETSVITEDIRNPFKKRFISRIGDKLEILPVSTLIYIYSENKGTYLVNTVGKRYLVDHSLEEVELMLDPEKFFRLNRKYISSISAVAQIRAYNNGRVKVELQACDDKDIVLSREKTRQFKEWLNK